MNRNKSPNNSQDTEHNSSTPNGRKRRLHIKDIAAGNLDKSKTSTANEDEDEDYDEHDDSFQNRKSLRIKNKSTPNQSISPASSQTTITPRKTKENTNQRSRAAVTSSATSSSSSISSTSNGNDRKLNGAQFLAAAAAGNFNVSASIGSTSITIDSNTDLSQLNHNVEILTKTLVQHSILLKHLNGSIEKLSNRLDSNKGVKKQYNTKSKQQQQLVKASQNKKSKSNTQETEMNEEESIEEQIPLDESQTDLENNDQPQETTTKEIQQEQHQQNPSISTNRSDKPKLTELTDLTVHIKEDQSPKKQQEPQANEEKTNEPVTQTVKLTNIDQLNEETPRQSNSFYYLSDSSKSDDDDDEDEDEDEKEEDDNNTREGKKTRRSSIGLKSPTKAILNKTKIDTDFISKLIASKDPNDKRYDPGEINKLRLLSHSYQNFAVKLLIRLFDEEEIIGRNVYGRNYSGDKSFMKQPLDPERINFIKETVLKLTKTNNPELAWASCVIAMNRKMVDINNKFIKSQQK